MPPLYLALSAFSTQEQIFNKLTNNGELQGLYYQDGKWYINAEFVQIVNMVASSIISGILKSKDGNTYFNLDSGDFVSVGITGRRVAIAQGELLCFDENGNSRVWIGDMYSDSGFGVFFSYPTDSSAKQDKGGLYAADGGLMLQAPDLDSTSNVTPLTDQRVGWKTINGVKTLVAY